MEPAETQTQFTVLAKDEPWMVCDLFPKLRLVVPAALSVFLSLSKSWGLNPGLHADT